MALTYPRDMMVSWCKWRTADFTMQYTQEISRTRGGAVQARDFGPELWRATFMSYPMKQKDANQLHASFLALNGAVKTFYAYPVKNKVPFALNGENIAAQAVAAVTSTGFSLKNLPAGFQITAGDFASVYNGTTRLLFQFAETVTADGTGATGNIETTPAPYDLIAADDPVTLENPLVEMRLIPDTLDMARSGETRWTVGFEAQQVLF